MKRILVVGWLLFFSLIAQAVAWGQGADKIAAELQEISFHVAPEVEREQQLLPPRADRHPAASPDSCIRS